MLLCSAPTGNDHYDTTFIQLILSCFRPAEGHGHLLWQPECGHVGHPPHCAPLRLRLWGGRRQRAWETCSLLQPLPSLRGTSATQTDGWTASEGLFLFIYFFAFLQYGDLILKGLIRGLQQKKKRERIKSSLETHALRASETNMALPAWCRKQNKKQTFSTWCLCSV